MENNNNTTKKSYWGYGITALILSFVVFMSWMVYMSVSEDFYLVTDNYYTEGVNFDEIQERIKNVKSLDKKLTVAQGPNNLEIVIPTEVKGGTVHFFRPSNGTLDFTLPLTANAFEVDKTEMLEGKWVLKFSWTDGEKEYYIEKDLFIL